MFPVGAVVGECDVVAHSLDCQALWLRPALRRRRSGALLFRLLARLSRSSRAAALGPRLGFKKAAMTSVFSTFLDLVLGRVEWPTCQDMSVGMALRFQYPIYSYLDLTFMPSLTPFLFKLFYAAIRLRFDLWRNWLLSGAGLLRPAERCQRDGCPRCHFASLAPGFTLFWTISAFSFASRCRSSSSLPISDRPGSLTRAAWSGVLRLWTRRAHST